jgi:hypothetical protein
MPLELYPLSHTQLDDGSTRQRDGFVVSTQVNWGNENDDPGQRVGPDRGLTDKEIGLE